ncbi:unnamed protein product [Polarella glacialis]|uniref:Uncharacterized protein n=1 Tax=Polarella glacialis TaxID=89957 RepID=A0A813II05_POLGL|nr:unnamed protein product [Polarella glacialis]
MPPSPDAALPRRQDEHGAWWRQTIAGRWVQWEPGWHRGQRRQREQDRQVLRLVAMCFRLSQHHGSMPPKLVADLFTNRWFSGDGLSGGGGGKDFSSREDKDFKRQEAAAEDKDSSGGGGKYSSSSGGKDCKFQASAAEARTDSKQHVGGVADVFQAAARARTLAAAVARTSSFRRKRRRRALQARSIMARRRRL